VHIANRQGRVQGAIGLRVVITRVSATSFARTN
jgi:hypothetical protein